MKTNAVRILEQMGIAHEIRHYDVDPDDLAAETVARKVGLPAEQVFKTLLVLADDGAALLAVVAGDAELDLKALARASGHRRAELAPLKDLFPITGYIRGGVTALATKKELPVYIDEEMELYDVVSVSAGVRGQQILLAPADYIRATHGTLSAVSRRGTR